MMHRLATYYRGVFRNASIYTCKRYITISLVCCMGILAACTPSASTPIPVSTITLMPPTATIPATPVPPTATSAVTLAPEITIEVVAITPTLAANEGESLLDVDPIASQLTFIAQRLVAEQTGLATRRIQVLSVSAVTWLESSLGCPREGEMYTQTETDGYRIVLAVGDTRYIYHTDIDRVIACPVGSEVLPEGFVDPLAEMTPEATVELTPEVTPEVTIEATEDA